MPWKDPALQMVRWFDSRFERLGRTAMSLDFVIGAVHPGTCDRAETCLCKQSNCLGRASEIWRDMYIEALCVHVGMVEEKRLRTTSFGGKADHDFSWQQEPTEQGVEERYCYSIYPSFYNHHPHRAASVCSNLESFLALIPVHSQF